MGMTMTQKILAAHAGLEEVTAGQLIEAKLDLCLGNDITAPVAINEFERCGACQVFDRDRVALVMDHFTPNKDIKAAEQVKKTREFAHKQGVTHFYDVGRMGIEHALLPEQGLVGPGTASSAPTAIPAPMALWGPSPPASAPPTWPPAWRLEPPGSRSRRPSGWN